MLSTFKVNHDDYLLTLALKYLLFSLTGSSFPACIILLENLCFYSLPFY